MAEFRVLSKEVLNGFDKYKYNAVDTSPLSNYVMHPFWNQVVKLFPRWIAPNVITFSGFLLLVVNFISMIYYDLDFYASSRDHPECPPVPSWLWLACAINNFLSHTLGNINVISFQENCLCPFCLTTVQETNKTGSAVKKNFLDKFNLYVTSHDTIKENLDGIDGKQARRTGSSSPLGELFDHGLDSWASFFLPVAMYSVFGRGEYGVEVFRVYLVLMGVNVCFITSHWEKYNTGVLFLPWGYDVSQIGMTVIYLITYFKGYEFWKFTIFGYYGSEIFEMVMYFGFFGLSFPITFWNIYVGYRDKTGKMLSLTESFRPLVSTTLLCILMVMWTQCTSYDILQRHPRIFYWTTGTAFSNIACRLIIAQMSSTRCELINWLLVPLFTIVLTVYFLNLGVLEFYILCGYSLFVTVSHVYFGYSVVNEMCIHFKINAFSLPKTVS